MTWQLAAVGLLVALALLYLARSAWRTWTGARSGCAGGCGCAAPARPAAGEGRSTFISSQELTLRRRDGMRP